ncbi:MULTISPECIES: hypothetical protein [unclassified Pseudomonas]|uniref:hypothetical protein n=1 Tax=unclassified Pseudomonas TaxID=196821 RepID=UPI0010671CF8|nr:hypothetical protein [Pseudomonas sp. SXM-1]QBQ08537.1 hypothetical protein DCC84_01705 [Pseudomonas sp. SXM-1]
MGFFFEPYQTDCCCLCGSPESLTGEHKVKASALRKIFGREPMVIGSFDGTSVPRDAQGPKSQAFHFSARICALCNSTQTQAPDREFDRFHALVSELLSQGKAPETVFSLPQYDLSSTPYLNVSRYFAKLLCCHVAESGGPRPLAVSEFSLGRTGINAVGLYIDADPTYETFHESFGEHKYAAHGGLIVPVDSKTQLPTSFRSSLTLGAVRYIFWVRFGALAGLALQVFHQPFFEKCQAAYREALRNPLSDDERRRLGI